MAKNSANEDFSTLVKNIPFVLFLVRKQKKKDNDPPLRLLDDLFRKTQTTPSIYWLPLTPEQVNIFIKIICELI